MQKKVTLLGATGSIGDQTIDIIRQFPDIFCLHAIAAGKNKKKLKKIQKEFSILDKNVYLSKNIDKEGETGKKKKDELLQEFCRNTHADIYVNSISGEDGIPATLEIIKQEKTLCLANKESLVAKGKKIMKTKKCKIIPVDSEHSSMANLLLKVDKKDVKKIWLTASGGPFREQEKFPKEKFNALSAKDALKHPTWTMGQKISVDSATLMNKAFELIEAYMLFDFDIDIYQVVVHPQSIIHAAIETHDGNIIMEASEPSMHLPIARALFEAAEKNIPQEFTIKKFIPFGKNLSFEELDEKRFPSIKFAKKALKKGEKKCAELLKANDEAVEKFLNNEISFAEIFNRIEKVFFL